MSSPALIAVSLSWATLVSLEHHRQRALVYICQGRLAVLEDLEGRGGDPMPAEELLAEDFAALELGSAFSRTKYFQALAFEEIDDAGHERRLRPDDGEVDLFSVSELQEPIDVLAANVYALGRLGDSRIARSAVDFRV